MLTQLLTLTTNHKFLSQATGPPQLIAGNKKGSKRGTPLLFGQLEDPATGFKAFSSLVPASEDVNTAGEGGNTADEGGNTAALLAEKLLKNHL